MRNLVVLSSESVELGASVECSCVDSASSRVFAVGNVEGSLLLFGWSLEDGSVFLNHPISAAESSVISMAYLTDSEEVCLITATGQLLTVAVMASDVDSVIVEEVGEIQGGLVVAASWSPDLERLAVATDAGSVLLLSREWELLAELEAHAESIAWRGDGQFFAVLILPSVEKKHGFGISVWDRNGELEAANEEAEATVGVQRVGKGFAWKPAGELIAVSTDYTSGNRMRIKFYEKNTMAHGELDLSEKFGGCVARPTFLGWNADSDLLGVSFDSHVDIFYRENFHWYLKHRVEVCRPGEDDMLIQCIWDPEKAMRLFTITQRGVAQCLTFAWVVDKSVNPSSASVAVIDGDKILLTAFSKAVVPPPMAQVTLKMPAVILEAKFLQQLEEGDIFERLLVLTMDCHLTFYKDGQLQFRANLLDFIPVMPSRLRLLSFISRDIAMFVASRSSDNIRGDSIYIVRFGESQIHSVHVIDLNREGRIVGISPWNNCPAGASVVLSLSSGENLRMNLIDDFSFSSLSCKFPVPCESFCVIQDWAGEDFLIGWSLAPLRRLFAARLSFENIQSSNHVIPISQHCSSFIYSKPFFMFTNFGPQNVLFILDTRQKLEQLMAMNLMENSEMIRLVERGSRLVSIAYGAQRVVLQMPRGNLEAIHPRSLVLEAVKEALVAKEFGWALRQLRRHRMDLNLLFNVDPESFLANLKLFISQVDDADHLNLFLASIESQNVNQICDAFRDCIETEFKDQRSKFMLNILCSHVRKSPPDLEAALGEILRLRQEDERLKRDEYESEAALKYLLFLTNVDQLYDAALGLYDLKLAALIGRNSQKDPREYIPFLKKLEQEGVKNPFYMRYLIDVELGRNDLALENLAQSGEKYFPDVIRFTCEKSLFEKALFLFPLDKNIEKWKLIMREYGNYLMKTKQTAAMAASVFHSAGFLEDALKAYTQALDWKNALNLSVSLGFDTRELVYELVEMLKASTDSANLEAAARILLEYCEEDSEVDEAVNLLLRGNHFLEAIRISYSKYRDDLVQTICVSRIKEAVDEFSKDLDKKLDRFVYSVQRLRALREEKYTLKAHESFLDEEVEDEMESMMGASTLSQFTLASQTSISSVMSKSWSTTSLLLGSGNPEDRKKKSRRERKQRMKEGHPKEEQFLVREIQNCSPTVLLISETVNLLKTLLTLQMLQEASTIHLKLFNLIESVRVEEQIPMKSGNWPAEIIQPGSSAEVEDVGTVSVWSKEYEKIWKLPFLPLTNLQKKVESSVKEDDDDDEYSMNLF